MKKFSIVVILVSTIVSLTSCKKEVTSGTESGGNYGSNPRATVPDELVGYWLTGTSSIGNFWGYDGSYQGPAYEMATGYRFFRDGKAKQYFYYTSTSYYCRQQILGYREGTVVFDVNNKTFKFFAASGNYRRYDGCGSSQTPGFGETKQYGSQDLYPTKTFEYNSWSLVQENGKTIWRIPFSDGSRSDYVKSTEPQ